MEGLSLYLLSLVVVLVSFYLRFRNQIYNSNRAKLPPGSFGLPLVGETLQYVSAGPENFVRQRMEKYSEEVFATSLFGEKMAIVCGAAGNKFLLHTANDLVEHWIPDTASKLLNWGADSPGQTIKEVITKYRSLLHNEILRPESMKRYVTIMDSIARQHITTEWEPFQEVKVYPLGKKYTLILACRLLLGVEDRKEIKTLSDCMTLIMQGMFSLPINLPGTKYNRGMNALKTLKQELLKIIAEKKKTVSEKRERASGDLDILSRALLNENTRVTSDSEIALFILSLMLPSYEATSGAVFLVLKYLAELPHIYDTVYKEHMDIAQSKAPHELLNWEDVRKMKYSWNVICESMRLTSPTMGTFREAKTDINFAGITIPKGWKIHWSPFTTNKNPKYFSNPETFDPARFDGDGPTSCTFLPFSAGPRMCPGKGYSMFVILVYMYNVVTKFKLQKLIQDEKIVYYGNPCPVNGLPVRLQPHFK